MLARDQKSSQPPRSTMNAEKGLYVLSGCASTGLVLSTWKLLGIFFIHLQQDLNSSATSVSLVLGLVSAMSYLYGPIHAVAFQKFGARSAIVVGAFSTALGLCVSSTVAHIEVLGLIYAVLPGFGVGMTNLAFFTMSGEIFQTKLSFVNNTFSSSHALVAVTLAPLMQFLIEYYGWRGAMLILGGIVLQAVPISLISGRLFEKIEIAQGKSMDEINPRLAHRDGVSGKTNTTSQIIRLLRNPLFLTYGFSMTCATVARLSVLLYTVRYAQSVGVSDGMAVRLITLQEVLSMVCGPLLGFLTSSPNAEVKMNNKQKGSRWVRLLQMVPRPWTHACFSILFGISIVIPTLTETYAGFLVSATFNGIILGGNTALPVTVLTDLFGANNLAVTQGLRCFMSGVGFIVYPLTIGSIIDVTGSYRVCAFAGAILSWTSAFLTVITYVAIKKKTHSKRDHVNETKTDLRGDNSPTNKDTFARATVP